MAAVPIQKSFTSFRSYLSAVPSCFFVHGLSGSPARKPNGTNRLKATLILVAALAVGSLSLHAQDKPVIVVHPFTFATDVTWPYDMKEMQDQTATELKAKAGNRFEIATEVPTTSHGRIYTLDGEVTSWRAGNRAQRLLVGMGTGRETAEIHYWLTDDSRKRVIERRDTIRAQFFANAYRGSVGQLAHPFADKIAHRLIDAKLK